METQTTNAEAGAKPIMCVCPFCGSYDIDPEGGLGKDPDGTMKTFPVCDKCGASAPSVEAWNRRTVTVDMRRSAREFGIGHTWDEPTLEHVMKKISSSNCELATMQTVAEMNDYETEEDWQKLRSTDRIETEIGYWENLQNGYWEHHRTADY